MDPIARIRAFNRHNTQAKGLVSRTYLDSGMTMTEVRVLYELSVAPDTTARALSEALGLDEGHLSRILKRFERDGLLVRRPSTRDARQRHLAHNLLAIVKMLVRRGRADARTPRRIGPEAVRP